MDKNNEGLSTLPSCAVNTPYVTQSLDNSSKSTLQSQMFGDIIIETRTEHDALQSNQRNVESDSMSSGREFKKERERRYREKHKELIKERRRIWRELNRDLVKERNRLYRENQKALQQNASSLKVSNTEEIADNEVLDKQVQNSLKIRKKKSQSLYRERNKDLLKERSRLYRKRKKVLQKKNSQSLLQEIEHTELLDTMKEHEMQQLNVRIDNAQNSITYSNYLRHKSAHKYFQDNFKNNRFGYTCSICDRLWFQKDLKKAAPSHKIIIKQIMNKQNLDEVYVCLTCKNALDKNKIPSFAVYNGFQYPEIPSHLPKLDFIAERLISPRIPFMQIRRLRHINGQSGMYGQVINVPVSVDTMVTSLPRNINDEHCIYVHIKKKLIHKSCFVHGLVRTRSIKMWLRHLINTPLYKYYNIKIDESFFNQERPSITFENIDEFSEDISIEESLMAQQQTLLWNDEKYLRITPGQDNIPHSILFDEHAEELSFPTIYAGQFRKYKEEIKVTPFMMISSELRRKDRRGVTPYHLLYMAVKIMRLRIRDSLLIAFKHAETDLKVTKEQILSVEYINNYIESNLAFLRFIPNSVWYWAEKKKDLFAMIRQIGKPTAFMTLNANEIGWPDLLEVLYMLAPEREDNQKFNASELNFIQKCSLINNDAVTCAIYFNKLINVLIGILQSKKSSPFGKFRVSNYFKRIDFQHHGSPHAHILLWLDNDPKNIFGEYQEQAIQMIDSLVSVSTLEASGNIKLQTHKHTFVCYKKVVANRPQKCRFDAPFMPCRFTMILTPMKKTDQNYKEYLKRYAEIRVNLESTDYISINEYYEQNNIRSDEEYRNILRAGIERPKIFYKRDPSEKWHNAFNPFVLNVLQSNMDFQIITDEYSCAEYVVEYINKTNREISNLQRNIIQIMNEHPEFDIVEITRKMSIDMLNTVEMTSQEAAWYLLREPMSKSSIEVQYINTCWPIERQRIRKTQTQINELDADSTDIWKEDWFDKYEKRPGELENVSLAQFVSKYIKNNYGIYVERKEPIIIRYRNYDIAENYNEYRREMVTLHFPFRNEDTELLAEMKFINIYNENEDIILKRRKEFEVDLDIQKTISVCRQLYQQDDNESHRN